MLLIPSYFNMMSLGDESDSVNIDSGDEDSNTITTGRKMVGIQDNSDSKNHK